jgi:hypothetical protein
MQAPISTSYITADQFYLAFLRASCEVFTGAYPGSLSGERSEKAKMTHLMLDRERGVLALTVRNLGRAEMHPLYEKYKLDLMICDQTNVIGNKIKYRQPLFVHAIVEHENGPNPEEEFWKLLHHYTPLKVIVFYSATPSRNLEDFSQTFQKVNVFLPRSNNEEYLAVCGEFSTTAPKWKAWKTKTFEKWTALPDSVHSSLAEVLG